MSWINLALKIIPVVAGAVNAVEKISKNKSGKEKKEAALEAIETMISTMEISISKELLNEEEFKKLMSKLIDDYVAVQNFIKEHQSKE